MKHKITYIDMLTEEEHEEFFQIIEFLHRKRFPINFKSILKAGLNQLLSNYFRKEWREEKKKRRGVKSCLSKI